MTKLGGTGHEKIVEKKGKRFLLKVEDSSDHKDYLKYEELREEIWHWPADALASTRNMMCENLFFDGSSLYIALFAESDEGGFRDRGGEHLVGFAYGFVGVKDKRVAFRSLDNLQFYSQYTGVKPGYERYGLGVLLKEFQKEALIQHFGIHTVTCTYDPLTGVNAYRNIHHFGMEVIGYNVDIYGEFGGRLNRVDVPSDRFTMSWDLRREVARPAYEVHSLLKPARMVTSVEHREVEGKSGQVELGLLQGTNLELVQDTLLVEIPVDYYQMLQETDVKDETVRRIPREWRMRTREAFQSLFEKGYRVFDFRQLKVENRDRDFYVFKKS